MINFEDDAPEYVRPNKSQMKREAQAMMTLAKKLVELPMPTWQNLSLGDEILDALYQLREMKQFGAKKRQLKLVAKMLRFVDTQAAMNMVEDTDILKVGDAAAFHKLESWRDRLLEEDSSLTQFMESFPAADGQKLRQLIRKAKQEQQAEGTSKSAKLLFKFIKECIG